MLCFPLHFYVQSVLTMCIVLIEIWGIQPRCHFEWSMNNCGKNTGVAAHKPRGGVGTNRTESRGGGCRGDGVFFWFVNGRGVGMNNSGGRGLDAAGFHRGSRDPHNRCLPPWGIDNDPIPAEVLQRIDAALRGFPAPVRGPLFTTPFAGVYYYNYRKEGRTPNNPLPPNSASSYPGEVVKEGSILSFQDPVGP